MANARCPKCGSYNTGIAYLNYAEKAVRVTAKFAAALALGLVAGQAHGAHAGHQMMEKEDKNKVKGHVCHKCGHKW